MSSSSDIECLLAGNDADARRSQRRPRCELRVQPRRSVSPPPTKRPRLARERLVDIETLLDAMPWADAGWGTRYSEYAALDALVATTWADVRRGRGGDERVSSSSSTSLVDELVDASADVRAALLVAVRARLLVRPALGWALGWYARTSSLSWVTLVERAHVHGPGVRLDALVGLVYALLAERPERLERPLEYERAVCVEVAAAYEDGYWGGVHVLVAVHEHSPTYEHDARAFVDSLRAHASARRTLRLAYDAVRHAVVATADVRLTYEGSVTIVAAAAGDDAPVASDVTVDDDDDDDDDAEWATWERRGDDDDDDDDASPSLTCSLLA